MKNHTEIDPDWEKAFDLDDDLPDDFFKDEESAAAAPPPAPKPKMKPKIPPDFNRLANSWFWGFVIGITLASLLFNFN